MFSHKPIHRYFHGDLTLMGPTLIFDKSLLESLNPDEAMWLDNFFVCNITPLFFIETLADLEKGTRANRTPEQLVGSLAYKTPDANSACNMHHTTLIIAELLGKGKVEMGKGRPIIGGGQYMELGDKTGVIFHQSPEEEAFQRWQRGEFLQLERSIAKGWRNELSHVRLEEHYKSFQRFFPLGKPKTLADVKAFADFYINGPDQEAILTFGLSLLGIPESHKRSTLSEWISSGKPRILEFAPFFHHVYTVDFFFALALAADLISRDRPSHKIDIAYIYYIPFCNVFTSNDKLHLGVVPLFLRPNQTFIRGSELKADLVKLDKYYDEMPSDVKAGGVISFAFYPPLDSKFLVSQLWDRHMSPKWREHTNRRGSGLPEELSTRILKELKTFKEKAIQIPAEAAFNPNQADQMIVEKKIHLRKGKWLRFPPEAFNS